MSATRFIRAREIAAQKVYAAEKNPDAVSAPTFTPTGNYVPPSWPVRAGANDHLDFASKGFV